VKHARDAALDSIEPVLIELRQLDDLREKKRGVFYKKSIAFIHFTKTRPAFSQTCAVAASGSACL
jgi:hypothetical protein